MNLNLVMYIMLMYMKNCYIAIMFPCTAYSTSEHSCQALLYFISLYIHEHECFTEMDDENMLKNLPFENFHDPQTIRLLPRKFMKRKKKQKKEQNKKHAGFQIFSH